MFFSSSLNAFRSSHLNSNIFRLCCIRVLVVFDLLQLMPLLERFCWISSTILHASYLHIDLLATSIYFLNRYLMLFFLQSYRTMTEYIGQKKPLGGLLLLLPRIFSAENKDNVEGDRDSGKELIRNLLVELEQLLIHANIRVSGISIPCFLYSLDWCCHNQT